MLARTPRLPTMAHAKNYPAINPTMISTAPTGSQLVGKHLSWPGISPSSNPNKMDETLEQIQARHRKELNDLQSRITNKKKNATKKTRKGVNDECAELERLLCEQHAAELAKYTDDDGNTPENGNQYDPPPETETQPPVPDTNIKGRTSQLANTTVSLPEPNTSNTSTPTDTGLGQGGKKRNRQKERLARRAAEQEAVAAAAESEAATMVDRRGQERVHMEAEMRAHALAEKEIAPDGHCLFSAVADQLGVHGMSLEPLSSPRTSDAEAGRNGYKTVRRVAAEYMARHGDEFSGFVEGDFGGYVERIRDTAEWGGQLELSALANAYGVEIRVVQEGRTEVVRPREGEGEKTLWLAYYRHGYGLGEHYNSLRKA